jgi:hypothetical protein
LHIMLALWAADDCGPSSVKLKEWPNLATEDYM